MNLPPSAGAGQIVLRSLKTRQAKSLKSLNEPAPRCAKSPAGSVKLPEEMQNRLRELFSYERDMFSWHRELLSCFGKREIGCVSCSVASASCPIATAACEVTIVAVQTKNREGVIPKVAPGRAGSPLWSAFGICRKHSTSRTSSLRGLSVLGGIRRVGGRAGTFLRVTAMDSSH